MCSVPLSVPEKGFNTAARVHMYVSLFLKENALIYL